MSRPIDADALIHELNNSHYPGAPYVDAGISIAIGKVCDAPTIEPEPCEELDFVQEHKKIPVVLDIQQKGKSMPSAQPEQSVAQARYEDLCDYFKECSDQGKSILLDREEFKAWLERMHWHVVECDKLARQLEAQPEPCEDAVSRKEAIREAKELFELGECHADEYSIIGMLNSLPAAQQEMKTTSVKKAERKTIYLDDALEAIRKLPNAGIHWLVSSEAVFDVLLKLPSAQPETCEGCKHLGKWENEVEYGYPSSIFFSDPCTRCKRRAGDHYER